MAYCPNCGTNVQSRYCHNCGTEVKAAEQTKTPDASSYYVNKEVSRNQPAPAQNNAQAPDPSQYKMGWHKWLIYFILWLWMVIDASNGITCMQYAQYASGFLVVIGLAYLAMAVVDVVVRFQLAKFKEGAPKMLLYLTLSSVAVELLFYITISSSPYFTVDSSAATMIVARIAFAIGNHRYYASRSDLFVY